MSKLVSGERMLLAYWACSFRRLAKNFPPLAKATFLPGRAVLPARHPNASRLGHQNPPRRASFFYPQPSTLNFHLSPFTSQLSPLNSHLLLPQISPLPAQVSVPPSATPTAAPSSAAQTSPATPPPVQSSSPVTSNPESPHAKKASQSPASAPENSPPPAPPRPLPRCASFQSSFENTATPPAPDQAATLARAVRSLSNSVHSLPWLGADPCPPAYFSKNAGISPFPPPTSPNAFPHPAWQAAPHPQPPPPAASRA